MDGDKSRREKRKEARLQRNKKKHDSWVQHQKSHTKKKNPQAAKLKNEWLNNNCRSDRREAMCREFYDGSSQSFAEVLMREGIDDKMDSLGILASDPTQSSITKKRSKGNSKTVLEKHLETENDGVPSVIDSLNEVETFFTKEASTKKRKDESSFKKCKKSKILKEKQGVESFDDGLEHAIKVKTSEAKVDTSKNFVSVSEKGVKWKKTKFEKYVELENQRDDFSAEQDLELEKKLAKKLKVKGRKFWGDDDGISELFEGIPSVLDSEVEKISYSKHASAENPGNTSMHDKEEQKSSKGESDVKIAKGFLVGETEQVKPYAMESSSEMVPAKATISEGKSKYVAPHLRSCMGNKSEEHSQICRRVRGLLNRLSESNVESITGEMFTIFQSVGRAVASQIITEEVLATCSGGPRGNEQHAATFAAFVAGMACLAGIDFGAKLLASLAKCFEEEYLHEDNLSLRNLTLLLSYLYLFNVCSSDLIYDFLLMLSKRLMEVDVSTILTLLQCCGMRLRGDDPVAMKNFILTVQGRVNDLKTCEDPSSNMSSKRMEFMLETICDIKNNKKRAKDDTVLHTRIKKWLQKLRVEDILIRGLKWSKLLDPDKKGQWWLSGDLASSIDNIEEVASTIIDREVHETQKMLQLAATQRMNTDARRAIFCIIMSSDDYIDAFEKLLRLDLSGKQDREIVRVLVDCCLQEKVFNKYYCVLASKFCGHDKNHKFTLQYCLWDHLKELETMELLKSMHLSKFIAEMLASFSLSLVVLKIVDLSDTSQLTPKRIMHFRMLFEAIFEFPDKFVWNIFTRIAVTPEYETLRNGIVFFVSKYVVNGQKSMAEKFKLSKKALNNVEGVLM